MARYSAIGADTNTDNTSILNVYAPAASMRRAKIYDLILGAKATPADQACAYELQRHTTAPSGGSAVTPQPLDSADAACVTLAHSAAASEPTYTAGAYLLRFSLNQRATFRWVANPGGELVIPATANNGIGIVADTPTSAVAVEACVHFEE